MDQLPQWLSSDYLLLAVFVGAFLGGELAVLAGVLLTIAGAMSVPGALRARAARHPRLRAAQWALCRADGRSQTPAG